VDIDFVDEHLKETVFRPGDPTGTWCPGRAPCTRLLDDLYDWDDADLASVLAVVFEPDLAVDLGVEGVVLAEPDVETGIESPPLLPDEDGTARHEIAVVALHAETLGVAVASVP
jgi:hypothetical protein